RKLPYPDIAGASRTRTCRQNRGHPARLGSHPCPQGPGPLRTRPTAGSRAILHPSVDSRQRPELVACLHGLRRRLRIARERGRRKRLLAVPAGRLGTRVRWRQVAGFAIHEQARWELHNGGEPRRAFLLWMIFVASFLLLWRRRCRVRSCYQPGLTLEPLQVSVLPLGTSRELPGFPEKLPVGPGKRSPEFSFLWMQILAYNELIRKPES